MRILILFIALVSTATPYGLFVSDTPDSVFTGSAIAMIKSEGDYEELSLFVIVRANHSSKKYAWLLPFPAQPEIGSIDYTFFDALSKISAPVYKETGYYDWACSGSYEPQAESVSKDYYEVLRFSTTTAIFERAIYTDTVATLIDSLANHGIILSQSSKEVIQSYTDKGWKHFYMGIFTSNDTKKVGVKIRFATNEYVLPMFSAHNNKFTYYNHGYYSIPYDSYYYGKLQINVYTYTLSAHKKAYALGLLGYANHFTEDEIQAIDIDFPGIQSKFVSGDYLTKLKISYLEPSQSIKEDITLQDAPDDDEYREIAESYDYVLYSINPIFLLLAFLMLRRKLRKS